MQRRRLIEREKISGHSSAVVVDHRGEPRLGGLAIRAQQQNVKRRVIGLPDGVWPLGFAAVNKFEGVAVSFRSLVSERNQVGG
jgi:hypothetical protein